MIALLRALASRGNLWRQEVKLTITVALIDLVGLIILEFLLTLYTQQLLHPAVSLVGLVWIIATATTIWLCGGLIVDTFFAARILGIEVGKLFVDALAVFFFLQVGIVTIHLVVPFWTFWPGYCGLIVALLGWTISGRLSGVPFNWNKPKAAYIALCGLLIALTFLFAGYKFLYKESLTSEKIRVALKSSSTTDSRTPATPLSGTFDLPAGTEVKTGLIFGPEDKIQLEQLGTPAEFGVIGNKANITVPAQQFYALYGGGTTGNLTLKGGEKATRVRVEVRRKK